MFITFEGGEGSGKSSVIRTISAWYEERKIKHIVTREPGGVDMAEKIRELLLDVSHTHIDARTEALLFAAARRQHLVERIIPALKDGNIVLCDRFIDSSLVYQGIAQQMGIDSIRKINEFAIENYWPNLTFYLDVEPSVGLTRIKKDTQREINRLDKKALAFHQDVRKGYLELAAADVERIRIIDASSPLREVVEAVKFILSEEGEF